MKRIREEEEEEYVRNSYDSYTATHVLTNDHSRAMFHVCSGCQTQTAISGGQLHRAARGTPCIFNPIHQLPQQLTYSAAGRHQPHIVAAQVCQERVNDMFPPSDWTMSYRRGMAFAVGSVIELLSQRWWIPIWWTTHYSLVKTCKNIWRSMAVCIDWRSVQYKTTSL